MTTVPLSTLGPTGYQSPPVSQLLAGVQADMNAAFGGNLNAALSTPQGQLAVSIAAVLSFANDQFAFYVSQVDPAFASGRMQDGIARIYFLQRKPAAPTVVLATCTGAAGTVIPLGALARASDGTGYAASTGGTIPLGGSILLPFAAVTPGPIACPAGSLTTIYQTIAGWDSITNPSDGALGVNVESRADFEARRSQSVALNAVGTLPSIRAAVLSVAGVLDAYVTENATGTAATIGGVSVPARSLFVSVAGGADLDVATAIWRKKNPGCGYSGTTSATVFDSNAGYNPPYPSYTVSFTRPASVPVYFAVSIASSPAVPANALALIQTAVLAAFSGSDGSPRATIGSTIYASRYYGGIAALGPWAQIVSIAVGTTPTPTGTSAAMRIDQVPSFAPGNVTVATV